MKDRTRTKFFTVAGALLFVFIFISIMGLIIVQSEARNQRWKEKMKGRTDIRVEAIIGVPSENKLGGIKFTVSDGRWKKEGYSLVVFYVEGFNAGLTLDKVCLTLLDKNKEEITRLNKAGYNSVEWSKWPERFQEVLAEATIGEKDTTLLDSSLIPVE